MAIGINPCKTGAGQVCVCVCAFVCVRACVCVLLTTLYWWDSFYCKFPDFYYCSFVNNKLMFTILN